MGAENPQIATPDGSLVPLKDVFELSDITKVITIFIDCSSSQDNWLEGLDDLNLRECSIGYRLACRFFFGTSAEKIRSRLVSDQEFRLFELSDVASLVEKRIRDYFKIDTKLTIVMPVIFDEYQKMAHQENTSTGQYNLAAKMSVSLRAYSRDITKSGTKRGIVFLPALVGVAEQSATEDLDFSSYGGIA